MYHSELTEQEKTEYKKITLEILFKDCSKRKITTQNYKANLTLLQNYKNVLQEMHELNYQGYKNFLNGKK